MAWLAAVTVAGAALRFYWLDRESLWYDEALSYWYTTQEYGYLWNEVPGFEIHPPLYGIMLKWWVSIFGDGEAGLRSLSALASAAAVPVTYYIGRIATSSQATGLYAAAFMAFSPAQLYYAQEARPYAMMTLAAAICMAGAFWMMANPARAARPWLGIHAGDRGALAAWAAISLGSAFAVWTHNMGAMVALSLLLTIFPAVQWKLKGSLTLAANAMLAACVALALWAPFLPSLAMQSQQIKTNFWQGKFTWDAMLEGVAHTLHKLFPVWHFEALALALVVAGALAARREIGALAACSLVGLSIAPLLIMSAASLAFRPLFLPRTALWATIPFFLLMAVGLSHLRRRAFLPWALVIPLMGVYFAHADYKYYTRPAVKDPWRDIVRDMAAGSPPGSVALVIPNSASVPVEYYARRHGGGLKIVPLPAPYPARWMARDYPISVVDPAIKAGDEKLAEGYDCRNAFVWLVRWGSAAFDPGGAVLSHLTGRCGAPRASKARNIIIYRFGYAANAG